MVVIGITGGMGCGKGYCCAKFDKLGIPSIDTDKVSRIVVKSGGDCLAELVSYFGSSIIDENGELNRRALAELAFADSESTLALNKITHKYIIEYCDRWLKEKENEGCFAAILDAPLLFESGIDKKCDEIISVICPLEKRIERIISRDGISRSDAMARISKQHTEEFFISNSDFIIKNNDGDDVVGQVSDIVEKIKEKYDKK